MDRYLVVSSDGHAGPPANRYRDYLDPAYRTMFDEHQRALQALILQRREELGGDNSEFIRRWEKLTGGDGGLLAAHDSAARLAILDSEGVTCEVLYPDADVLGAGRVAASPFGSGLGGGAGYEPDVAMAGARANRKRVGGPSGLRPPQWQTTAGPPTACAPACAAHRAVRRG